jgi:hypothetical protein
MLLMMPFSLTISLQSHTPQIPHLGLGSDHLAFTGGLMFSVRLSNVVCPTLIPSSAP